MLEINSENKTNLAINSTKVIAKSVIEIAGTDTQLAIEHVADFSEIPVEFHQIYFDSFKALAFDSRFYDCKKQSYPTTIEKKQKIYSFKKIINIILRKL